MSKYGYLSDGSWEQAVIDVVIAGEPKQVFRLAQGWSRLAQKIPDHGKALERVVKNLCETHGGWYGKAATKYDAIVTDLIKEIGQLAADSQQLASNIDDAGQWLSDAIAHIPVPLTHTSSWGNVDHALPNGTHFDSSLHHPAKFDQALVSDYQSGPGRYANFAALEDTAADQRAASQHSGRYTGIHDHADTSAPQYPDAQARADAENAQRVADWYNSNAGIATHWYNKLRSEYTDQRRQYRQIGAGAVDEFGDLDDSSAKDDVDGTGSGADWSSSAWDTSSEATGGTGSYQSRQGLVSPGRWGNETDTGDSGPAGSWSSANAAGSGLDGNDWSALAGSSPSTGYNSADSGTVRTGAGDAGSVSPNSIPSGLVRPGSATSGPDVSPVPPLTSPRQALSGTGASADVGEASTSGVGVMPQTPGQGRKQDERRTWLTEDEDLFRDDRRFPPPLIE